MYLRILRKDLKRKKTMNLIMLIFIILAATFMSSSANNLITVVTALDDYFEMAEVPDYWYATPLESETARFQAFAEEHGYGLKTAELIQTDPKNISVSGETFDYGNVVSISTLSGTKVFDEDGQEILHVNDGEIYVSNEIFRSEANDFYNGCSIDIDTGTGRKEFTLKGYTKDALYGSPMIGMTRFLVSEKDYQLFDIPDNTKLYSLFVYTEDETYLEKVNQLDLSTVMNVDYATIKMVYVMDTLIAAVIFVVSVCLVLISMVILGFIIHFTLSEEYREIGVMKAIGIPNGRIRGLYVVKYLAISIVGAVLGLILSVPFGSLLIGSVSENIILSGGSRIYLNVVFAAATAAAVVVFCYSCTRQIRKFSPIDAIRNGETGERYSRKGMIHLSRSFLAPVPFMAVNDILSGIKRYVSMLLIFTIGLLLIILPVNAINTLQSDGMVSLFNVAECDHVITQELLFSANGYNRDMIEENLEAVRRVLQEHHVEADVFQEIMFRFTVSYGDRKSSSIAFQGMGQVTADRYTYLEGTPPQNENEVALSYVTADRVGAGIGDQVEISMGEETRKYTVCAINQSMNNLGEGIRFYQEADIDYDLAAGCFGIQIAYRDDPDGRTMEERKELLQEAFPENTVYTAVEYINYMIGSVAEQIEGVKSLILGIVLCINILVSVLMVRSFLTKEKGEIAMLKAMGFRDSRLVAWQSLRIGIVLLLSSLIGTVVSIPLSRLVIGPIFRMMGAYSIRFAVKPLEVYAVYPLILLTATVLAAATGALRLRKISASETSNVE